MFLQTTFLENETENQIKLEIVVQNKYSIWTERTQFYWNVK